MRMVKLDGERMRTIEEAHAYIASELGFPEYYGGNLDALWDELSTMSEPCHIRIQQVNSARVLLGEYGDRLMDTFLDASEDNEYCIVELSE
jgi:ribonuclease inhibitor